MVRKQITYDKFYKHFMRQMHTRITNMRNGVEGKGNREAIPLDKPLGTRPRWMAQPKSRSSTTDPIFIKGFEPVVQLGSELCRESDDEKGPPAWLCDVDPEQKHEMQKLVGQGTTHYGSVNAPDLLIDLQNQFLINPGQAQEVIDSMSVGDAAPEKGAVDTIAQQLGFQRPASVVVATAAVVAAEWGIPTEWVPSAAVGVALCADHPPSPFPVKQALNCTLRLNILLFDFIIYHFQVVANALPTADLEHENNRLTSFATDLEQENIRLKALLAQLMSGGATDPI